MSNLKHCFYFTVYGFCISENIKDMSSEQVKKLYAHLCKSGYYITTKDINLLTFRKWLEFNVLCFTNLIIKKMAQFIRTRIVKRVP